jgi:hypothetical protein
MAPRRLILVAAVGLLLAHGSVAWGAPARVTALAELHVDGVVDGDVVALGGDVVLGPNAVVHGHAVAVFGSVRAAPGASVEGRKIALASLAGVALEPTAGEDGGRLRAGVRLLTAGGWLLATTLIAFVWPVRIRYGVAVLPQLGLKVVALGAMVAITLLAALIAAIGLGPMAGLPLAAVLGVAFLLVKAVGLTVLGGGIGAAVFARLAAGRSLPLTASVFVGVLAMLMVRFLPVIGGAAWTLLALVALGAGVFAVTMAPHRNPAEVIGSPGASNR